MDSGSLECRANYEAIIFDFDYTLGDSSPGIIICMRRALMSLGFPPADENAIKRTIGLSLHEAYKSLSGDDNGENAKRFIEIYVKTADEIILDMTSIYTGVPRTLAAIRGLGVKTAVVSTKYRYRINDVFDRDGLSGFFDLIVGGEDVNRHKPDPEGILKALKELSVAPRNALYIGDSETDAVAARNAGVDFAAVLTGVTPKEVFTPYLPLAVVATIDAIPSLIA